MPFRVQGGNVKDIFVTEEELIERFTGKQLWLWGVGTSGQLGDNTATSKSSPVQTISGGNNWRSVGAGNLHTAAIKTDGTLWLWGSESNGVLGNGGIFSSRSSPVQTTLGGTNWRTVGLGQCHSVAIKTDGTLWRWGAAPAGPPPFGNSIPIQNGGTDWLTLSSGWNHVAALKTDGTLWLWGVGSSGQLGNNAITNQSSPVQTISGGNNWRTVSANIAQTAAIKIDGTLWLWGCGSSGQLGDNTATSKSSPVQTISGGNNWRSVGAGRLHTAAIKTDGTLWIWGLAGNGVLGDNSITNQSSPVQTISGGTNWRSVSAGSEITTATKTDGSLWTWGRGNAGQLGNNLIINQSSPVQTISGGTNWRNISATFCTVTATRLEEF